MPTTKVPGSSGVELAARIEGDAAAPPLVLLHALGETSECWVPLLPELTKHYRVVAFDLRGHGASDWPGTYSSELNRDDVITAVDALELGEFALVGHSLGGVAALLIAEQLGERVTRLVIEDAVPPYPRELRQVPERPDEELPFDWAVLEPAYAEMTDPEMRGWPALAEITAPTLVVAGGPTSNVPSDRINEMAGLIPDCTVRTLDTGHYVHQNAPEEFTRIVLDWLTG